MLAAAAVPAKSMYGRLFIVAPTKPTIAGDLAAYSLRKAAMLKVPRLPKAFSKGQASWQAATSVRSFPSSRLTSLNQHDSPCFAAW